MDLSTKYLGISLPHPLMAGASPLSDEMDTIRRLEDAGCAAIVLRSLFDEQIVSVDSDSDFLAVQLPVNPQTNCGTSIGAR